MDIKEAKNAILEHVQNVHNNPRPERKSFGNITAARVTEETISHIEKGTQQLAIDAERLKGPPPLPNSLAILPTSPERAGDENYDRENRHLGQDVATMYPWATKSYSENLFEACEALGYGLESDPTLLREDDVVVRGLVIILRQIGEVGAGQVPFVSKELSSKICLSATQCVGFMTEHEYYDEALLCADIVPVLSLICRLIILERGFEASFNLFPAKLEGEEEALLFLVNNDAVYSVLDCVKDLSANDEIESYFAAEGMVEMVTTFLRTTNCASEITNVAIIALANLTTNAALHPSAASHHECVLPAMTILISADAVKHSKESAAAVLRNLSADSRTAHYVAEEEGAIARVVDALRTDDDVPVWKKNMTFLARKDLIGVLRNLSTHDDWDEELVAHGAVSVLLDSMGRNFASKKCNEDLIESCAIAIRNLAVNENVAHVVVAHGLSSLANTVLSKVQPAGGTVLRKLAIRCHRGAIKAIENVALFAEEHHVAEFIASKTIACLVGVLEDDEMAEDDDISAAAMKALGSLVQFAAAKEAIIKVGGKSMVTMLNVSRKQGAPEESKKTGRAEDFHSGGGRGPNQNRQNRFEKVERRHETKIAKSTNLGFGGKSSRFSEALISDMGYNK